MDDLWCLGASEKEIRKLVRTINNDSVLDEHGATPFFYAVERCNDNFMCSFFSVFYAKHNWVIMKINLSFLQAMIPKFPKHYLRNVLMSTTKTMPMIAFYI